MIRRSLLSFIVAALPVPALSALPLSPDQAPRATPRLLRELDRGAEQIRVIVGVKDGTPSARALLLHPDPDGEPRRRARRLAAQKRLAEEFQQEDFQLRHYYESFSMLAGIASRRVVLDLASRPDVEWVELDGSNKPWQGSPQNAQLLIKSDQTNALGFRGAGQTVAVLDTGVDYNISVLGGGGFPNAKVIGGTDTADKDSDPMDCEGHGTSVAAIIAGPTGVAPDAKIVAVKVFPSQGTTNSSCKPSAFTSDIVQGINYAITNKATFGITAINLSLGDDDLGGADLRGYCDSIQPSFATAIDSATAAGIVVTASSGNGARSDAIATPACVSSSVSVGAVYPVIRSSVSWLDDVGGIQCTDAPAVPDQIACFSDSSTGLSLLAPGAFWQVATKGGSVQSFHGTSASAPTVAGAVALLKQAHPELTASAIVGILRSSGKPITDARNGVVTPRLDTLAAVELALSRFASYAGPALSIPDGTVAVTATATLSGFTGSLATVQVWVEIDHPEPAQLRLTLIGPDGTSVILQDQAGPSGHPINSIYGKTAASQQPLSLFGGKQANGTWTLRVEDKVAGIAGRIRNFAVTLIPGQPIESIPPASNGSVLPVVAHTQGTKFFQSDVRLYNPSALPRTFSLYYVAAGQSGATAAKATRTVGAGQVLALNDVLLSEYNYTDSIGQITVLADNNDFLVTSRAYTQGDNGNFGLYVPGFASADGLAFSGGSAAANGLSKTPQFHCNVGFTEVSGAPVTVRIDVIDSNGVLLASTTRSTDPNTTYLITDIIADRALPNTSNFRVDFTVTSATGRIVPFATYVDEITGDGSFQAAINPAPSSEDIVVPQTAHVLGANGDFFKTNFNVSNLDSQPVTLTVSLIPLLLSGTPNPPRVWTLAPGQTIEKPDVLQTEFNLSNPSAAGLRIHPSAPARLAVSTRTFVQKFGGTFGSSLPGTPASSAIGLGAKATAIQLDQTSAPNGYRSNFGFTEVAGAPATVRVTIKSGETGASFGSKSYSLPANTSFQANVTDILGAGVAANNLYAQFQVESGAGRILAYAATIDNQSGDTIFIPAQ